MRRARPRPVSATAAANFASTNEYGTLPHRLLRVRVDGVGLGSSYTTVTLPSVSCPIAKDALEPGDILNNPLPGTSGHVVLFAGWADAAKTPLLRHEESPSGRAQLNEGPLPYWPGYGTFTPRRYIGTTSKTPVIPPPAAPAAEEAPDPVADGDFVRHDKQVYRIVGGAPVPVSKDKQARKLTDDEFAELATQPADGTFLRAKGEQYVIAGGAPVFVPAERSTPPTRDRRASGHRRYLPQQPADGTIVRTDEGALRLRRAPHPHVARLVEALRPAVGHHRRAGGP